MMEDLIGCTKEVVNMEKKRVNNEDKIQQRKDESLFKIETSLPEIHANANDPVGTINALEKFEKTLEESKVTTRAVWVRFFREKCKRFAKDWIEASLLREPGLGYLAMARRLDDPAAWDNVYAHLRARLLQIGTVDFELVQDKVEHAWKAIKFTSKPEMMAIQNSIQELTKGWKEMCRVNLFIPGDVESDKKLMRDLRRKVPEGSQLAFFLTGKDYEATTLDEWIALIQVFQRACPAGSKGSDGVKSAVDGLSDVRLAPNAEEYIRAGKDVPMTDLVTGEDVRKQVDIEDVVGEDGVPFGP
jgi:hypothetical protein